LGWKIPPIIILLRLQTLVDAKTSGKDVDDAKMDVLEREFETLKAEPDLLPEEYIAQRRALWEKNPDDKQRYVDEIEERRAYYSQFAQLKGEPEIVEMSKLAQHIPEHEMPLPGEDSAPAISDANDIMYHTPGFDLSARTGLYWDETTAEVEHRYQNLREFSIHLLVCV